MEDKKSNLKIIIAIIAVVAVIAACAGVFFFSNGNYKTAVKNFSKAIEDTDNVDKLVEKSMDVKAMYALTKVAEDKDIDFDDDKEVEKAFKKEYKEAKKDDYEDLQDDMKEAVKMYAEFYKKLEVKEIGKLEEADEEDGPKFMKTAKVTFKNDDGDEVKFTFLFYKNKIVSFNPEYEESDDDYEYDDDDYEYDDENIVNETNTVDDTNTVDSNTVDSNTVTDNTTNTLN